MYEVLCRFDAVPLMLAVPVDDVEYGAYDLPCGSVVELLAVEVPEK